MPHSKTANLRAELKEWENTFLATHGRKPEREDIKQNREIAAKYKAYTKIRHASSAAPANSEKNSEVFSPSKTEVAPIPRTPRRKSKRTFKKQESQDGLNDDPFQPQSKQERVPKGEGRGVTNSTPSMRNARICNATITPTRAQHTPTDKDYGSPLSLRRFRFGLNGDIVGATPQKVGKILGIFESASVPATPPNSISNAQERAANKPHGARGSPLKRNHNVECLYSPETPKKRKINDNDSMTSPGTKGRTSVIIAHEAGQLSSPISQSHQNSPLKDLFATPPFLRRSASQMLRNIDGSPPVPVPRAFKPPSRGLSSLMAELRKMQDDTLDQEEEILREIEAEHHPASKTNLRITILTTAGVHNNDNLTQDTISENALEDPDANTHASIEKGQQAGTRTWKKKGLKRQTRRVIMRPLRNKSSKASQENDTQNNQHKTDVCGEDEKGEDQQHKRLAQERILRAATAGETTKKSEHKEGNCKERCEYKNPLKGDGCTYDDDDNDHDNHNEDYDGNESEEYHGDTDNEDTFAILPAADAEKLGVESTLSSKVRAKTPKVARESGKSVLRKPKGPKRSATKENCDITPSSEGTTQKVSKKSSTAHANYRKLKIRSSGRSGAGGKAKYYKRRR